MFDIYSPQIKLTLIIDWKKAGRFRWSNASSSFEWRQFNAPRNGYGVSVSVSDSASSTWWNWPRHVKKPALVCQKTVVMDWNRQLRLRLTQPSDRQMAVTFRYTPEPMTSLGIEEGASSVDTIDLVQPPLVRKKWFWLNQIDVVCRVAGHAIHFRLPAGYQRLYRTTVAIPASVPSGLLSCEAWINQPAFRFWSNSIVYQTPDSLAYVVRVERRRMIPADSGWWFPNHLVEDLASGLARSNLTQKILQPLIDWRSVTAVVDQIHPDARMHSKPQVRCLNQSLNFNF